MDGQLDPLSGFAALSGLEPALATFEERLGPLDTDLLEAFASGRLEAALSCGSAAAHEVAPRELGERLKAWLADPSTESPTVGALDVASTSNALEVPWLRDALRHALADLDLSRVRDDAWPLLARWSEWARAYGPWRPRNRRSVHRSILVVPPGEALSWQLTTLVWCGRADAALLCLRRLAGWPAIQDTWQRPLLALVACGWQRQVFELIEQSTIEVVENIAGVLAACADAGLADRVLRWLADRPARELGRTLAAVARCAGHHPRRTFALLHARLEEAPLLLLDLAPSLLTCLESPELEAESKTWIIARLCEQLALDASLLADARLVGAVLEHDAGRTTELMEYAVRSLFPQRIGDSMAQLLQRLPGFAPRVLRQLRSCCETLEDLVAARHALRQLERLALPLELDSWLDQLAATSTLTAGEWNDRSWRLAFSLRGEDHRAQIFRRLRYDADQHKELDRLHRRLRDRIVKGCHRAAAEPAVDRALQRLVAAFESLTPQNVELLEPIIERHGPLAPVFRDASRGALPELALSEQGHGWRWYLSTANPGYLRCELPPEEADLWFDLTEGRHRPLPVAPALATRRLAADRSEIWTRYCGPSLDRVAYILGSGKAPPRAWLTRIASEAPPELAPLHAGIRALVRCLTELQQALGEHGFDPGLPGPQHLSVELIDDEHWTACRAAGETVNTLPWDARSFSFDPLDLLDPRWRVVVRLRGPATLRQRVERIPELWEEVG